MHRIQSISQCNLTKIVECAAIINDLQFYFSSFTMYRTIQVTTVVTRYNNLFVFILTDQLLILCYSFRYQRNFEQHIRSNIDKFWHEINIEALKEEHNIYCSCLEFEGK